jgi:hypothetical protein
MWRPVVQEARDATSYRSVADTYRITYFRRVFGDESVRPGYQQYAAIFDDLIDAGVKFASSKSLDLGEFQADVLFAIGTFVQRFGCCFFGLEELKTKNVFWSHMSHPVQTIVEGREIPKIDRLDLESCVGLYINLPVRSQRTERVLIDALVAVELLSFGKEMFHEPKFPTVTPLSPFRQPHPLWAFTKGQIKNLVMGCIILAILAFLTYRGWIGEAVTIWAACIVIGLLCVGFLISLAALPAYWTGLYRTSEKVRGLLKQMSDVYGELNPHGLISARFIRERAAIAAERGVIWPSSLFVLLEDVEARAGYF